MQFVILVNVSVHLAMKEMTHTTLQLDVQLSPNVNTTPIVDTMRSVPKYKTATHDSVWMPAAELLVVQTHFA